MKINLLNRKPTLSQVIIDTGPLLIFLTLNYVKVTNKANPMELLIKSYDKIDRIQDTIFTLQTFFDNIKVIKTTPHVIGELIGLANSRFLNKFNDNDKNIFWEISLNLLTKKQLKEELITLVDLYNEKSFQPLIPKIGVIDTEIIMLSKKLNIPILSIDTKTLKVEAEKKNVDVLILQEDIYEFIN